MAAAEENLREIYPNPGSITKSDVWKFFGFYKINDNEPPSKKNLDTTQAVCRLCRKIYRNTGNTTNFRAHIDGEHKLPSGNSTQSRSDKVETKLVQPTISAAFVKRCDVVSGSNTVLSQERRGRVDDAIYQQTLKTIISREI
ncbi:uncharacterized protein LOC117335412 [Pecten maximus]|nr:uncharacterized protein LOC117315472 [Pecten maximus]XP_033740385.1 uncharacterized protein LOC117327484 [Pecten maximus]XP_033740386.1 uncharacterized protein LOC117327485 [Pecten maximus]XP_033751274.1 uncharacterized protein LOC117335412 [Pecten maximus]